MQYPSTSLKFHWFNEMMAVFAYLNLPFLVFSAVFSLLFSLLLVFSWSGRELIFIRARVAVTSSSQTTLPGTNRNTKHKCTWCHQAVTSPLPCWKKINDKKSEMTEKAIRSLAGKVIFFNTPDKLKDTQFSAYYKTQELIKNPKSPKCTTIDLRGFLKTANQGTGWGQWIHVFPHKCD